MKKPLRNITQGSRSSSLHLFLVIRLVRMLMSRGWAIVRSPLRPVNTATMTVGYLRSLRSVLLVVLMVMVAAWCIPMAVFSQSPAFGRLDAEEGMPKCLHEVNPGVYAVGELVLSETAHFGWVADKKVGRTHLAASGYWKYDGYQITPTPEELAAIKPMPGRVHELRASGGLQAGPGDAKGSIDLFFKTDNPDREVFLTTSTLNFGANANLVTLVPGQKVVFEAGMMFNANDHARALREGGGAYGTGSIAIDNGENIVNVSTRLGQTANAKGEATIPGGGPGATMFIHVSSQVSQLGGFRGVLHIRYVWVADTPPPPTLTPTPTPTAGSPNLALNRPAKQSSTSQWSQPNDAQGAVDGNVSGGYGFHTESEPNPWWQVDLGAVKTLAEIRIFNRRDCCPERARTLQVLLSNDGVSWKLVFSNPGTVFGADGTALRVSVKGLSARFVRLQLAKTNYLHLDEVQVYGAKAP